MAWSQLIQGGLSAGWGLVPHSFPTVVVGPVCQRIAKLSEAGYPLSKLRAAVGIGYPISTERHSIGPWVRVIAGADVGWPTHAGRLTPEWIPL
jgi:hypothetical protein